METILEPGNEKITEFETISSQNICICLVPSDAVERFQGPFKFLREKTQVVVDLIT